MEEDNSAMIIICVIILIINLFILNYDTLYGVIIFAFAGLWAFLFLVLKFIEFFER